MTIEQKAPKGTTPAETTSEEILRAKMIIGGEQVDASDGQTF